MVVNTKTFANVHLRRALALAIDRAVLPHILHGGEIPSAAYTQARRSRASPPPSARCAASPPTRRGSR